MNNTPEYKLVITINNKQPVELTDLAKSMISLADEYRNFLIKTDSYAEANNLKLYVKEIKPGSIIQELVALGTCTVLPFIEHSKTIVEFTNNLKVLYYWFSGKSETQPPKEEKKTLQNLSDIIEPIAKDHGSQITFGAINVTGDMVVQLNLNSTEANASQNEIRRQLESMREPITGFHSQVVMYWAQARNKKECMAGDKAKIESLYKGDVKVIFENIALKKRMFFDEPHPFNKAYLVDVMVETIEGKPILYKVLELHQIIDLD